MKYVIILIVVVALLLYTTNLWRYIQTGFLIAQTKPYTQSGSMGTILVLGDSTGYGTGVRDSKNSVAGRIGAAFPEYTILNNSVNGRAIEDLTETVTTIEGRYDLILLQIGANDIMKGRTLATVQSDLEAVLTKLRQHTDAIVMISAGNVGAAPAFDTETAAHLTAETREFKIMFANVCAAADASYVDLFVEPDQDVLVKDPATYMCIDGLHPNDAGYGVWFSALAPILEQYLKK